MSEITKLEQQKKDKGRVSVYIDGAFYCGMKLEVVLKNHLKEGMLIEKSQLDNIQLENERSQALDKALTHLSASMKTQKQIVDFLTQKGYTQAVCDDVIDKLKEYGYVNDEEYCRAYVGSVSGKGKRKLEADLIKRGADRKAIEAVLDELEENGDQAVAVLEKYMRGKEYNQKELYKAFKYLMSKGFGYDTAKAALEKYGVEDEDDNF
jgi:regulatory protein